MILKETIDGKEINVIKSSGYNDGYYWDMNATVIFNGNIYTIIDSGSESGWNLCYTGAKESWEDIQDEDFDFHTSVDGKEVGRHGELED